MDDILETNVNEDFLNEFNSDSHSDTNPEHFENQVDDSPHSAVLGLPPPAAYSAQNACVESTSKAIKPKIDVHRKLSFVQKHFENLDSDKVLQRKLYLLK
jgi:hypothetical protein